MRAISENVTTYLKVQFYWQKMVRFDSGTCLRNVEVRWMNVLWALKHFLLKKAFGNMSVDVFLPLWRKQGGTSKGGRYAANQT